jgi:hypothetical protein
MLVGDTSVFAIESEITAAHHQMGFRALGYFTIHIGGQMFGVRKPDATMLACSFDAVEKRLSDAGLHTFPFCDADAASIVSAYEHALFIDDGTKSCFGVSSQAFRELLHEKNIVWTPDGDEAFDDRSHILQFDIGDRVRLIAFHRSDRDSACLPQDINLDAKEFYSVLRRWHDEFEREWQSRPKAD